MTAPARPDPTTARVTSPGWWVEVVAAGHLLVGAALFRDVLADVARRGVVGTVPLRGDRATAFWFLLAAPSWWALGQRLRDAERTGDTVARHRTGAAVATVGAVGSAMMPASPFWTLLALGLVSLRGSVPRR